jgi:hypothetical protein
MARIDPLRQLLLYRYRRVTVAFESHEERSPGVPADTSEKTGLPKLRILNRKYGRREKLNNSPKIKTSIYPGGVYIGGCMKQKRKANARFYSELRQTDSWVVVELTNIRAVADDGDEELFGTLFLKWQGGLSEGPDEWTETWNHYLYHLSAEREEIASKSPDPELMLEAIDDIWRQARVAKLLPAEPPLG